MANQQWWNKVKKAVSGEGVCCPVQILCVQTVGVFTGLVDNGDSPTVGQLCCVLMDQQRVAEEGFSIFPPPSFWKVVTHCCRDSANTSWPFLFSVVLWTCPMKGSWQSIICSNSSLSLWRKGRTRLWWMMLKGFQPLTWKTGTHCELSGEIPHTNMSIWPPSIIRQMFTCVYEAYHWERACAGWLGCLKADCICWTGMLSQQFRYH